MSKPADRNETMQAIFRSHKIFRLKPLRKKGLSGFYEAEHLGRVFYIDDNLNVRTGIDREPLKWKNGDKDCYQVGTRLFVKDAERKLDFCITAIRLVLWLYGDADGNTVPLFNNTKGKSCIGNKASTSLNPKCNRVSKSLKQKYIHYDIK